MIRIIIMLGALLWSYKPVLAQVSSNMSLLGNYNDHSLPISSALRYNDIWGYAVSGKEYAIIGSLDKIHFLDVTDPSNITEVGAVEATIGQNSSIWRDIKTYGTYAYAVADQSTTSEGLMVMDISNITGADPMAPAVTLVKQERGHFTRAHNIYIDTDNGVLYAVGVNVSSTSMVIYDLTADPANPSLMGSINLNGGYIHDVFVENHIAYCSHGNNGLYIYDMSPLTDPPGAPGTPVELAVIKDYAYEGYNHSSWVSGNILVFADETHGSPLTIADISDLDQIEIKDFFYSNLHGVADPFSQTAPRGPIPHNPFIVGDYCIASYYHDGVSVFDISDPTNVTQAGYYDTSPASTDYDGYDGCWGVYPFLPSGNIIASDDLNGLFVLEFMAPFPVEWESFTANQEGRKVRLDWRTANQHNNLGFDVQKQGPRGNWESLGWVNPNLDQSYRFYDHTLKAGWNTYRIVQEDFDGKKDASSLVSVHVELDELAWKVFPNPVVTAGLLYITEPGHGLSTWQMYDGQGRIVLHAEREAVGEEIELSLPSLPAGTYWLRKAGENNARTVTVSDN